MSTGGLCRFARLGRATGLRVPTRRQLHGRETAHGVEHEEENNDGEAQPREHRARAPTAEAGQEGREEAGGGGSPERTEPGVPRRRPVSVLAGCATRTGGVSLPHPIWP